MIYRAVITLVILVGLGGCALIADQRPPEEIVAERAATHLELLRLEQWDEALAYTTPAFRSKTPPDQYAKKYGGVWMWQSTRVGEVSCDGEPEKTRCEVQTYRTIVFRPQMTKPREHYKPRTWINVDGQWFIFEN